MDRGAVAKVLHHAAPLVFIQLGDRLLLQWRPPLGPYFCGVKGNAAEGDFCSEKVVRDAGEEVVPDGHGSIASIGGVVVAEELIGAVDEGERYTLGVAQYDELHRRANTIYSVVRVIQPRYYVGARSL